MGHKADTCWSAVTRPTGVGEVAVEEVGRDEEIDIGGVWTIGAVEKLDGPKFNKFGKGSLFEESCLNYDDLEDGSLGEEGCGVCGDWNLECGGNCRRQGCADGCGVDTGGEAAGEKDSGGGGDDRKLEAMEPDWCPVKHSGVGPEDSSVGLAPVKCRGAKEVKKAEKVRRRAKKANIAKERQQKDKAKRGTDRQVDRSTEVGEVIVFMFMY